MLEVSPLIWIGTLSWFGLLIAADLYINKNNEKEINFRQSVWRSVVWICLGLALGLVIWLLLGRTAATDYYYGFIIEKSLSVDNIFVWGIILSYLKIPKRLHYDVLFWGILGAIVFRAGFIIGGTALINNFQFVLAILGFVLLYTSYSLLKSGDGIEFSPDTSRVFRFVEKVLPFTNKLHGKSMFVKENGRSVATLLFFAVCVVELTDILFAVDSVPAILAVVRNPYIALTSNIAAILGLRALYFVFANIIDKFWLLSKGLAIILGVLGISLLFEPEQIFGFEWFHLVIPSTYSLLFVFGILALSIAGSLIFKKPE